MKKYIVMCMFTALSAYSQEGVIVPLSTSSEVKQGTYLKDISNDLAPYTGFWEGTWNGNQILFKVSKKLKHKESFPSGYYYYNDELIVRYKITNMSDNTVIADNLNESN